MRLFVKCWLLALCISPMLIAGEELKVSPSPKPTVGDSLALIVMDPLAAELACPCVKGYAQRNYHKLAELLSQEIGRPIEVFFAETLKGATEKKSSGRADIIIGKSSVVKHGAGQLKMDIEQVGSLTGQDGETTQTGLFVVPFADPALEVADLKEYRIIYGPPDCDEKYKVALEMARQSGLIPAESPETSEACSDGANLVLQIKAEGGKAATVISSYAKPLLEGCGTINKGDLRVIGETRPVPFVTAFVNKKVAPELQQMIKGTLLKIGSDPAMCKALETKRGFVPPQPDKKGAAFSSNNVPAEDWTGWRGPRRDGRVPWLPETLSAQPHELWRIRLTGEGVGGVAATGKYVVVSDRELGDTMDVFRCLRAEDGEEVWSVQYPTHGQLDFGNSPRATPLIHNQRVFLAGAHGDLHAVDLDTGEILWQMQVRDEFEVTTRLHWGFCGSPLIVNNHLIINPGGETGSLAGLDPESGKIVWRSDGGPPSYGSFNQATLGGKLQIVGHDSTTLGGWDPASGKRLWSLIPPHENDFNVPTPFQFGEELLVTTENNGTRLYRFHQDGTIDPTPAAQQQEFAPDSHTPVVVGNRLFGIWDDLFCLDLKANLKTLWTGSHDGFATYAGLIASDSRLLASTMEGGLILIDATADEFKILGECKLFEDQRGVYSHPAVVGSRLYLRGMDAIVAVDLDQP
ncbi:MAG: PQQ-binding-like beta-propeller repeat protein [Planctomycetaceae bacterium]|nr:PQQ-binding-like beta-propeller repeat protein [Planctomycetaceae bacterium]